MSSSPIIRFAAEEDVPTILAMIIELADYEHAADKVEATEQSLLSTLSFAPSSTDPSSVPPASAPGYAKTLLITAPDTSEIAGMALFFNNYSTWRSKPGVYLEDLYVRPQYRKRGYGKLLLRALAKEVKRIDGGRLEWSCLKWNEPSLKFYEGIGAERMEGWVGLRADGEGLDRLIGEGEKRQ